MASTPLVCATYPLTEATLLEGFCAGELPLTVQQARSIVAVGPTDFLTLERGTGSVLVGEDLDGDGIPESVRTLVSVEGLNHGLAISSTHLYASTPTDVYRWPFDPLTKTVSDSSAPEWVIQNMNADGNGGAPFGHTTRTLVVVEDEPTTSTRLYVSVGSAENIDPDSFRARIRVFPLDNNESLFPLDFQTGTVFADGLRNEVALELAPDGVLWGAGNSADKLGRDDLGGSEIYNDNPCEEVHRFNMSGGQNYGYPYCFREYELGEGYGLGRGTAWAWPDFLNDGTVTDQQCRDNYDTPVLALQAHSAPLGMTFYRYSENRASPECDGVEPFPANMNGDAFLALHGSWNREVPTGYKVVHVPVTEDGTGVVGGIGTDPIDLLQHQGDNARWNDGFRPVDLSFDACGRLLVSSDGSDDDNGNFFGAKIVRIERVAQENNNSSPSTSPSRVSTIIPNGGGGRDATGDPTPVPLSTSPIVGSPSPFTTTVPLENSTSTDSPPRGSGSPSAMFLPSHSTTPAPVLEGKNATLSGAPSFGSSSPSAMTPHSTTTTPSSSAGGDQTSTPEANTTARPLPSNDASTSNSAPLPICVSRKLFLFVLLVGLMKLNF